MTKTFTQASTPDQLQAQLEDKTFLDDLSEGGPSAIGEYMAAYTKAVQDTNRAEIRDLSETVKVEMQAGLASWLKDSGLDEVKAPAISKTDGPKDVAKMLHDSKGATGYNARAIGADLEKGMSSGYDAVDVFRAAYHKKGYMRDAERYAKLEGHINQYMADYTGTIPADGGILLPETLRSEIMSLSLETSVVRSRATVVPMGGGKVTFPAVQDSSHAASVFGGVTAYWEGESEAATTTSAAFSGVTLEPKKLRIVSAVPNDLIEDAPALEAFIAGSLPDALAYFEDDAFISGDGVGKPLGFKNASAAISVAKEGSQAADTILSKNIFKMYSRLLPTSIGKAAWIAHIDTFPQLAELNVAVGSGGNTIWLNSAIPGTPNTLLGMPVIFTEKMETLGDAGDIMLVDLSAYLIGDRQSVQLSSSPHENFSSDKTLYKVISRVDGRPWIQTAITPRKGSNTLSPFVKLAVRG